MSSSLLLFSLPLLQRTVFSSSQSLDIQSPDRRTELHFESARGDASLLNVTTLPSVQELDAVRPKVEKSYRGGM